MDRVKPHPTFLWRALNQNLY